MLDLQTSANKDFIEEVKKVIDSNKELLVMCKAGGRSMMASQLLSQENIKCINISDGFEGNGEILVGKMRAYLLNNYYLIVL